MTAPDAAGAPRDGRGGRIGRSPNALAARRALFWMVLAVVVLDAAAIALYSYTGLRAAGGATRTAFTALWTLATAVSVGVGLRRIRLRRRAGRGGGGGPAAPRA